MRISKEMRRLLRNLREGKLIQPGPGLAVTFDPVTSTYIVTAKPAVTSMGNTVDESYMAGGTYGAYGESGWEVPGP